jgi:hypothetical protein
MALLKTSPRSMRGSEKVRKKHARCGTSGLGTRDVEEWVVGVVMVMAMDGFRFRFDSRGMCWESAKQAGTKHGNACTRAIDCGWD